MHLLFFKIKLQLSKKAKDHLDKLNIKYVEATPRLDTSQNYLKYNHTMALYQYIYCYSVI